jgi:single-strand DNA-binding protein
MTINVVTLVGRTGQDAEIKYFETGSVKAKFSLAVDRGGSKDNRITDWFNIEAWGRLAEFSGEWVKKGQMLAISGTMELQSWTDQAGNTREFPVIKAQDIRFAGSKRENQGGGGSSYASAPSSSTSAGSSYGASSSAPAYAGPSNAAVDIPF